MEAATQILSGRSERHGLAPLRPLWGPAFVASVADVGIIEEAHRTLVSAGEYLLGSGALAGKRGFIAGGQSQGCQIRTRDLVDMWFGPMGLRSPDESLFSPEPDSYYLDWYDTEETRSILRSQHHSVEQWQAIMIRRMRYTRPFIRLFKAGIIRWIEKQSPRYLKSQAQR